MPSPRNPNYSGFMYRHRGKRVAPPEESLYRCPSCKGSHTEAGTVPELGAAWLTAEAQREVTVPCAGATYSMQKKAVHHGE